MLAGMNYVLGATQRHFSPSRWARVKRIFLPNDLTLCYHYYYNCYHFGGH